MKKHSWSYDLFYTINKHIGDRPWVDKFMRFCAHDLLYIMGFIALAWATTGLYDESPVALNNYLQLLMTAGAFGLGTSWAIGLVWPHPRPIRENPKTKQLIEPLGTWKSFPSDHTIASFTLALVTIYVGAPLLITIPLSVAAVFVSSGRVWVGVHYPRDVLGGVVIGLFFSLTSFWLLANITGPLYAYLSTLFL